MLPLLGNSVTLKSEYDYIAIFGKYNAYIFRNTTKSVIFNQSSSTSIKASWLVEFGTWVRSERERKGMTAMTLATKIGLPASKLSLIENERSEATLAMVVEICSVFGVGVEELLQALLEEDYVEPPESKSPLEGHVVTSDIAKSFITGFENNPDGGYALLVNLWQQAESHWYLADRTDKVPVGQEPLESAEALIAAYIRFHKLADVSLRRFSGRLDGRSIPSVYHAGGVLTFLEIGRYLQELRQGQKRTLADIAKTHHRSLAVLSRFEVTGEGDIRVNDILFFDKNADRKGEIFRMYWNAMIYPLHIFRKNIRPYEIDLTNVGDLFIRLCRIIQGQAGLERNWLEDLQNNISAIHKGQTTTIGLANDNLCTQEQWDVIKAVLIGRGYSVSDLDRKILEGILFKLVSGSNWQELPTEYGQFERCRDQFQNWIRENLWETIWETFRQMWTFTQQELWIKAFRKGCFSPIVQMGEQEN